MPLPKIIRADEPIEPTGLIVAIIGPPDAGKSLTAQTAKNPFTYAFDSGLYRAGYKQDAVPAHEMRWEDTMIDQTTLEEINEAGYATIVLDTGGGCVRKMIDFQARRDPKLMSGGSFAPRGYGYVSKQWSDLLYRFKYVWQKDLVIVDHIEEMTTQEGEAIERIKMPGRATVNEVYQEADLIGRQRRITEKGPGGVEVTRRVLTFSGNDRAYRKDPTQFGEIEIPDLRLPENHNWLGNLMVKLRLGIIERQQATNPDRAGKMIEEIGMLIDGQPEPNVDIAAAATEALDNLLKLKASRKQVTPLLERMEAAGYAYLKEDKAFAIKGDEGETEAPVEPPVETEPALLTEEA